MTKPSRKATRDEFPDGSWVRPKNWSVWHLAEWSTRDMRLLSVRWNGSKYQITGDGGWRTVCGRLFLGRSQVISDGLEVLMTEPNEGRCQNCVRIIEG